MKFKHLLTILLVLALCAALVFAAVACDKDNTDAADDTASETDKTDDTSSETETLLVTNGRFESYSEGTAPNTPSSWTGNTGDSTAESVGGVVSLKEADYTATMSAWGNLAYPGNVPDGDAAVPSSRRDSDIRG